MELKEGATVKTNDGQKVGTIDRIVVDPATNEVTHIVIEKGFLFTEDRILPVATFIMAGDVVVLNHPVDDLDDLSVYYE
jgi:uncharacterized protein YrrD